LRETLVKKKRGKLWDHLKHQAWEILLNPKIDGDGTSEPFSGRTVDGLSKKGTNPRTGDQKFELDVIPTQTKGGGAFFRGSTCKKKKAVGGGGI